MYSLLWTHRRFYDGLMTSETLTGDEIDSYWANGFAFVENALTAEQLEALVTDFDSWVEESRRHSEPYGETLADRPRFDLAPDHSAERPVLRRVASPIEISDAYLEVMRNNKALDAVAQLVGPNVEFNNSKINAKQPGSSTEVKYHQDFMFQPHTNEAHRAGNRLKDLTEDYDRISVYDEREQDQLVPLVEAQLDASGDDPFFAWVHFYNMHDPGWDGRHLRRKDGSWPVRYRRSLKWLDRNFKKLIESWMSIS